MTYEKHTWQNGEVITADKLNNIENGITESAGYNVTETTTLLLEETVTTENQGYPPAPVAQLKTYVYTDVDTLKVTFEGDEYICEKHVTDFGNIYGGFTDDGPVFTEYPFALIFADGVMPQIYTERISTHTVKVEKIDSGVEITAAFEKAIQTVVSPDIFKVNFNMFGNEYTVDKTYQEINEAIIAQKYIISYFGNNYNLPYYLSGQQYIDENNSMLKFSAIAYSLDNFGNINSVDLCTIQYYSNGQVKNGIRRIYNISE